MNHDQLEVYVNERLRAAEQARELQAAEYERRLELLNGEAERLRGMRDEFVNKDTYRIEHKNLADKVEILTEFKNHTQGKNTVYSVILPMVVSIVVGLLFVIIEWLIRKGG